MTSYALDPEIFIIHFQAQAPLDTFTQKLFRQLENKQCHALCSVLAFNQLLLLEQVRQDPALQEEVKYLLEHIPNLKYLDITQEIVLTATQLQNKYQIALNDALHLANAIAHRADYYLTANHNYRRVQDLKIKILSDI
jgi:predicted nucleic acid-binding protein